MTYIFIEFEDCKYWIEVGDGGCAFRQITINEKNMISISCLEPCLADQYVDTENNCEIITKAEFENMWEDVTTPYRENWNNKKQKYKTGQVISGTIKYFYPQGAVLDLDSTPGCAEISNCADKQLYPGCGIKGTVFGYDEENMWVLIGKCELE